MEAIKTVMQTPAIDMHLHYDHGTPYDHPNTSAVFKCTLDFLREEREAVNIALGCFCSYSSVLDVTSVYDENLHAKQMAEIYPWFFYWAVINPFDGRTYTQADAMLRNPKCVGIKIQPYTHKYQMEEYGDAICSFAAERGAVVLTHPPAHTETMLPALADRYRDCTIIAAHLQIDYIRRAKYGNLYTDTSGSADFNNNVVEYAVSQIGAKRIFFGTDNYSAAAQRGRIEFARISEDAKRDILYRNALRMFPKLGETYAGYCHTDATL